MRFIEKWLKKIRPAKTGLIGEGYTILFRGIYPFPMSFTTGHCKFNYVTRLTIKYAADIIQVFFCNKPALLH